MAAYKVLFTFVIKYSKRFTGQFLHQNKKEIGRQIVAWPDDRPY